MQKYDVIIIGAGAAGMFAAATATKRNRSVAVLDMGEKPLRKVFISGGGRCNFTNTAAGHDKYFGTNPDFVRSALAQFSTYDMLNWARAHGVQTNQKAIGQYFCENGSQAIIDALCYEARNATLHMNQFVQTVTKKGDVFTVRTKTDVFQADSVIVATGGMSYASMGVSDTGILIAKKFGHTILPVRPALCAISFKGALSSLAGISIPVRITVGNQVFMDNMLFTHCGVGGPAIYRATVRDITDGIHINLLPKYDVRELLVKMKQRSPRKNLATCLAAYMPTNVARWVTGNPLRNMAEFKDAELMAYAKKISDVFIPLGGFKFHTMRMAEAVRGGVSTDEISSKTMESKRCPGLYFVGELLDITGDLGGFNLQWAWSSGFVAGNNA